VRRLIRILRNTLISLLILALSLFIFTKAIRYPNPIASIKLGLAPASKTPTLMPWHTISASSKPIEIPRGSEEMPEEVIYQGDGMSFEEFLDTTKTNAFLVVRNGVLTYEWYREGFTASSQLPSYSVAKTMTSILIGRLIDDGKISESDRFVEFFPELANQSSFDQVTVKTLLDIQLDHKVGELQSLRCMRQQILTGL
jgi:CubicO group peptidase (beta-lactamase class C family)